jgi:6-phosphogluconolactonase
MKNREEIDNNLCSSIILDLKEDIQTKNQASLLVSGGSTPINLFELLSNADLEWEKVSISLVDDRFLPDDHKDQNGSMVRKLLIQNKAAKAKFIPLVQDSSDITRSIEMANKAFKVVSQPFSSVILGMGDDGHTASLFPDCDELDGGMDLNNENTIIKTEPKTAPYQRISLTRKAILNAKSLYLHFYGEEKLKVFEAAGKNDTYRPFPIQAFINQSEKQLKVFKAK